MRLPIYWRLTIVPFRDVDNTEPNCVFRIDLDLTNKYINIEF